MSSSAATPLSPSYGTLSSASSSAAHTRNHRHHPKNVSSLSLSSSSTNMLYWLDQVKVDAARAWPLLVNAQRLHKTFIMTALYHSPTLPSKSDFERQFPQSLRFDHDIVLGFAQRDDFVQLYQERHLFVPECCTDQYDIMLEYCKKIPRSLQDVKWDSLRDDPMNDDDHPTSSNKNGLIDDDTMAQSSSSSSSSCGLQQQPVVIKPRDCVRDLIRAAIQLDGMELQYVPLEYQEEFFEMAILQNGHAVRLCPNPKLMQRIAVDKQIMLQVVSSCGSMIHKASPSLQQDEELVLAAVCHGGLEYKSLPHGFKTNIDFLQKAILQHAPLYLQLSTTTSSTTSHNLRRNMDLCLAAVLSPSSTSEVQLTALSHQKEAIWQNRQAVLAMAQRGDLDHFSETLLEMRNNQQQHHLALAYSHDRDIMMEVVRRNGELLFTLVAETLRFHDIEMILTSIQPETAWNTLRSIPQALQHQHYEITLKAIQVAIPKHFQALTNHIPESMWRNHKCLILAWIRRGAPVLTVFSNILANDRELALDVAQYHWQEFRWVGTNLLSDYDFMSEAVQRDGRVLQFASSALQQDMTLSVRAVANQYGTLTYMNHLHHSTTTNTTTNTTDVPQLPPQIADNTTNTTTNTRFHRSLSHTMIITAAAVAGYAAEDDGRGGNSTTHSSWIQTLDQHVTMQLNLYEMFLMDFLRGICGGCTAEGKSSSEAISMIGPTQPLAPQCPLQLLDRGTETTQAWKRLIAMYIGVPLGDELRLLRKCRSHLERYYSQQPPVRLSGDAITTTTTTITPSTATATTTTRATVPADTHHQQFLQQQQQQQQLHDIDNDIDLLDQPFQHHHRNRFAAAVNRITANRALLRFRLAHGIGFDAENEDAADIDAVALAGAMERRAVGNRGGAGDGAPPPRRWRRFAAAVAAAGGNHRRRAALPEPGDLPLQPLIAAEVPLAAANNDRLHQGAAAALPAWAGLHDDDDDVEVDHHPIRPDDVDDVETHFIDMEFQMIEEELLLMEQFHHPGGGGGLAFHHPDHPTNDDEAEDVDDVFMDL